MPARDRSGLSYPGRSTRRQTVTLAANLAMVDAPASNLIASGTFTPAGTELDVTVRLAGLKTGEAPLSYRIEYGVPDGNGRLHDTGSYGPLIAGASYKQLQAIGARFSDYLTGLYDKVTLTGLTQGVAIKGQAVVIPSGAYYVSNTNFLSYAGNSAAPADSMCILPNGTKIYIPQWLTNDNPKDPVLVLDAIYQEGASSAASPTSFSDSYRRLVPCGSASYKAAASPDSGRVAVLNYYSVDVTIIETTYDSIERTVTLTDGFGLAICFANTVYAFVAKDNGKVEKINVVDGTKTNISSGLPGGANALAGMFGDAQFRIVGTTVSSHVVTDVGAIASDTGRPIVASGVPAATYIGTVTPGVGFLLSSSPSSQVNVNATATGQPLAAIWTKYVYTVNGSNLYRIDVNDNSVTTQACGAALQGIGQVGSDGRIYLMRTTGVIEVRNADLTLFGTIARPGGYANSVPTTMATNKARTWIFVGWTDGVWAYFNVDATVYPQHNWFDFPDMGANAIGAIVLSPLSGDIYLFETTNNKMHFWPNSALTISPVSGMFGPNYAELIVDGVA